MSETQDVYIPIHHADPNKRVSIHYHGLITMDFMEFFFVKRHKAHLEFDTFHRLIILEYHNAYHLFRKIIYVN